MEATDRALANYEEKLKKQQVSYDLLLSSIEDDLMEIQDLINKVKKKADGFDGYDFTEEIKSLLEDLI
jgi:hypothetical protein